VAAWLPGSVLLRRRKVPLLMEFLRLRGQRF